MTDAGRKARLSPFQRRNPAVSAPVEVIDAEFVHVDDAGNVVDDLPPEIGGPSSPGDFFRRGRTAAQRRNPVSSSVLAAPFRRIDTLSPVGFGILVIFLGIGVFWFSGGHALFP